MKPYRITLSNGVSGIIYALGMSHAEMIVLAALPPGVTIITNELED